MKAFFRRVLRYLAYTASAVVILLAIGVGLFRLFLPRVPEYQDEIKAWASAAIGIDVEFSGMDARWGLSGPELEFYDAELIRQGAGTRIVSAEEVRVGVGFLRLLFEQALVVDRVVIKETTIDVERQGESGFLIQGISASDFLAPDRRETDTPLAFEVIGEDISLQYLQPGLTEPVSFAVPIVRVSVDENRIAVDGDVRLPDQLGRRLNISATQLLATPAADRSWDVVVEADSIRLPGWTELAGGSRQFYSGSGDFVLALVYGNRQVSSATADLDLVDVAFAANSSFDFSGRVEMDVSENDWLIAANDFVISMPDHQWPPSTMRVEASIAEQGEIAMVDARASYLDLDDLRLIQPWLDVDQNKLIDDLRPSGVVRDLVATIAEIGSDEPRFDVSVKLDRIGLADTERRVGLNGFSGLLRANRSGGRLEIDSTDVSIQLPEYLTQSIDINQAVGTVIWRNSNNGTTILSDSISIASDILRSQSNVQVVLNKNGASPEIDLASSWSISDIAAAKRFIPERGLHPKLYDWFQMALVSGTISRGTTSLNGPLNKFPFDDGEGRLLIEASVRDMTFKYHRLWPATEQSNMEVVLDNARLYTTENQSVSVGIPVVNASVDIPDLRDPVLSIQSFSVSTLQAIREFSMQSPIANVFAGQLDRVSVSGDASFSLNLTVPLRLERVRDFEFVSQVRSNNGTLSIAGFGPQITDLIGEVNIERDHISSVGLGGRFLGETVSIDLAQSSDPRYTVVATADGTATADGIVNELGAPLEGLIAGVTSYQASILFPNNKSGEQSPLTIQIDTDLLGLDIDVPEPLGKSAESALRTSGDIRFMPGGESIESAGSAAGILDWNLNFTRPEDFWDLDRGVVILGGGDMQIAETRGLHIRGSAATVRLQDWLSLSRSGDRNVGAAERIRSIDLNVEDFFVIGQHLQGHHIKVDRSARDWLVQFNGDHFVGSVFVPYDFNAGRPMVLEMERLRLPGDEAQRSPDIVLDPRELPAMQLSVADFAFGNRSLGALEATLEKTDEGLIATSITSVDPSFGISASGRWIADNNDPLGSHSYVSATLNSTDVEQTMARLGYQPGIVSDDMSMSFDLNWSGSPRADMFDVLYGDVEVRLGNGQLEEVEPGAGRVFGLMSVVALPRRLSLDFRDVFNKGFGFDGIAGTFRIDNGVTYTCDLSLTGPAADIGIVGKADLGNRTYNQSALVAANFGNTLPIVGAVVAGPQVAAALLIFSQIFKEPLQEVGQVYYDIGGSWDEPVVESSNSAAFVASGELADCLADGE